MPGQTRAPAPAAQAPASTRGGPATDSSRGNSARAEEVRGPTGSATPTVDAAGGSMVSGRSDPGSPGAGDGGGDVGGARWGFRRGRSSALEPLAAAIRAGSVANANTAYNGLGRGGRRELKTSPFLLEYVQLIGGATGRPVLSTVKPPETVWMQIANDVFAGSNANLTGALQDMGVTNGRKLADKAGAIARFANLAAWAVLQPIVNAVADARNHGAILNNASAVGLVQGGGLCFAVLTGLDHAKTFSAYQALTVAQTWIDADIATLGTNIPTWRKAKEWVELMIPRGQIARVEAWYDAGLAAWRPPMQALLLRPSDIVRGALPAGNAFAEKLINGIAATTPNDAARACIALQWQPTQSFELAIRATWLDAASAATLATSDVATQEMLACTATIQAGLTARGVYILDAFPGIARSDANITRLYGTNAGFKAAIESDAARYAALYARIPAIAPPTAPGAAPAPVAAPAAAAGTPYGDLQTAVAANNRADALSAYNGLGRRDRRTLQTDALLGNLVRVVAGAEGRDILKRIKPARATWVQIGAQVYSGDAAMLTNILKDAGITKSKKLAQNIDAVSPHAAYAASAVLTPILADASASGQGACLASAATVTLLRAAFAGQHAFAVLTGLAHRGTLAAYRANLGAQTWLESNVAELATRIVGWNKSKQWADGFLRAGKPQLIGQCYDSDNGTWLPLIQALFTSRPSAVVKATFISGNALADRLIDAIAASNQDSAARACAALGWQPIQVLRRAIAGGWFSQAVLDRALPRDAAGQEALATDPAVLGAVTGAGIYPTTAFPVLARNSTRIAELFRVNVPFRTAMLANRATFQTYLGTVRSLGPWVEALLMAGELTMMLELANANAAPWLAGVNTSAGGIDPIIAAVPAGGPPNNNAYRGLYAVFGPPQRRTVDQCVRLYQALAGGVILPPGDRSLSLSGDNINDPVTGNAWMLRKQLIGMAPTLAAMTSMLNDLSVMPQSALAVNRRLIFVHLFEYQWGQTAPAGAVSTAWHTFASPQMRDVGTSYAGGGATILRTDGRGGPITARIPTLSDGAASATGGGSGRRNATTPHRLNFFQNHARHEFGHNVGQSTYPATGGGQLRGNIDACNWANWQQDTAVNLKADYWNPGGNDNWRVPNPGGPGKINVAISSDHAFTYLQTVLHTYNEPPAGNNVADNTPNWNDAWRRISKSRQFKNTHLVKYMKAIGAPNFSQSNAFEFPGFAPPTNSVHIVSTRWDGNNPPGFNGPTAATYDRAAFNAIHRPVGWYALSSPGEMFAEIYTKHYSGGTTPTYVNAGVNWANFFTDLDRSPAATANAGAGTDPAQPQGPAPAGETEPPAAIMRNVGS